MTRLFPYIVCLLLTLVSVRAAAQSPVVTYGTKFTFAFPEGADGLVDPFGNGDSSTLILHLISRAPGSATITSPSGYSTKFCYDSTLGTDIVLPHWLMLIPGQGKSQKGLVLRTTNPVQVELLDKFNAGGEMTQIYPDSSLGTDYRIATWGLYNDPGEDNKTEFVITAPYDNTSVTVTPSVRPIGRPDASPFTFTLNAGECYIVKADITAAPTATSLSGSFVQASRPVSVITALTCGYAPLGDEACNELLNMPLPRSYTDTVFLTAPFSTFEGYSLIFVSDDPNFFVVQPGGFTYTSVNGVAVVPFTLGSQEYLTTSPAQCYQLSSGYDRTRDGMSDPSMITVLPRSQWLDSVEWFSPDLADPVFGTPFPNYISVVYPQTAESKIMIDDVPALTLATPQPIAGTPYSNMVIQVPAGRHHMTSPEPMYAFASGFSIADAYSFNVGERLPTAVPGPVDSIRSTVVFDTLQAPTMCQDFDVAVRLVRPGADPIETVHSVLTFDPTYFSYVGYRNGPLADANAFTLSAATNTITIDLSGVPISAGSDTICILHFHCATLPGSSPMSVNSTLTKSEPICATATRFYRSDLGIIAVNQIEQAAFAFQIAPSHAGVQTTGVFSLVSPAADPIRSVELFVRYDHDVLYLTSINGGALVGSNILPSPIRRLDDSTDEVTVSFSPQLSQPGELLLLHFDVFVADSASTDVTCSTNLSNDRPCPLTIVAPASSATFTLLDTCSTPILREYLQHIPLSLKRIVPNPTSGRIDLHFDRILPKGSYRVTVSDVLGHTVTQFSGLTTDETDTLGSFMITNVASGIYFLDVDVAGFRQTARVLIRN